MKKGNLKLNNTAMVYVSTFDLDLVVGDVEPAIRNDMIQCCTDMLTRQQRYCVWKLLDIALLDCYGKGVKDFNLYINDNGKWMCDEGVYFSLSHCNNVVTVAVCNHAVGVDVEAVSNFTRHIQDDRFVKRVLTDSEQLLLRDSPAQLKAEAFAEMWTKKEALFKLHGDANFVPKSADTTTTKTHSQLLTINKEKYALSVATHIPVTIELAQVKIQ